MRSQETSYVPDDLWILVVQGNAEKFDYRPTQLKQLFRARVIHSQFPGVYEPQSNALQSRYRQHHSSAGEFPQIKEAIRFETETFKMELATLSAKGMAASGMIACIQGV